MWCRGFRGGIVVNCNMRLFSLFFFFFCRLSSKTAARVVIGRCDRYLCEGLFPAFRGASLFELTVSSTSDALPFLPPSLFPLTPSSLACYPDYHRGIKKMLQILALKKLPLSRRKLGAFCACEQRETKPDEQTGSVGETKYYTLSG